MVYWDLDPLTKNYELLDLDPASLVRPHCTEWNNMLFRVFKKRISGGNEMKSLNPQRSSTEIFCFHGIKPRTHPDLLALGLLHC